MLEVTQASRKQDERRKHMFEVLKAATRLSISTGDLAYPTYQTKARIADDTGLSVGQVSQALTDIRKKYKP